MWDRSHQRATTRIAAMTGGWGLIVGMAMLWGFGLAITSELPALAFLLAAGAGATLAGLATGWFFGRPGWQGWLWALLGGLLATGLGAGLAGMIALPPREWDLVLVALLFSAISPIALVWAGGLVALQMAAIRVRDGAG